MAIVRKSMKQIIDTPSKINMNLIQKTTEDTIEKQKKADGFEHEPKGKWGIVRAQNISLIAAE